jgi:dCMP deaminase
MSKQKDWDEYFMNIAEAVSQKSKDPSSKMGCVIVDKNKRVVSLGYNGMVQGADESKMTMSERPMKYYFSIHSEMNAVLFAHQPLEGCTIYNRVATCENCLKYCLQAGIKRFVYRELRVHSYTTDNKHSMTNIETDEAVVRLLASMPEVKTLNLTNGKTYIEDILDSYDKDSEEYARLAKWIEPTTQLA